MADDQPLLMDREAGPSWERAGWPVAERVAVGVLLATVAKLFLVDLARLEPLFRVLLFLGFGSVFLYLSYALSASWRARRPAAPDG